MSRLEDLPPDLRAVLSLLLRQRKGYDEVAGLLRIQDRAVRDRAHAALAMIAPRQARELTVEQRTRIGDYLLGQLGVPERARAADELAGSAAARDWAQALSAELAPLAADPLPEIPREERQAAPHRPPVGSRRGGALLLGAIAVVAIVAIIVITGTGSGGGGPSAKTTSSAQTSTTTGSTSSGAGAPKEEGQSTLSSPDPASKAKGNILVLSESGKRAFYLQVTGLAAAPSGSLYAVWLTGTGVKAQAVGVLPAPTASGQIEGGALLPTDAAKYHRVLVTRETDQHPSHPGPTVLAGALTLSSGR